MAREELSIPYGRRRVPLICNWEVQPCIVHDPKAIDNPSVALQASLDAPINSPPLSSLLQGSKRVLLVLSDVTRKLAYPQWLPTLYRYVWEHSTPSAEVASIVALGTHKPASPESMHNHLGERVDYLNHDARDEGNLVFLGRSSRGTDFFVNRSVVNADLVVTTTAVTYHYFSGFTGGVKAIFPGLAGEKGVIHNHGLSLDCVKGSFNPYCKPGNLQHNPVYEDFLEIVPHLPPTFSVNVVLNLEGNLSAFFSGNPVSSHRQACVFYEKHFSVKVREKPSVVILSAGGYPRDLNLYQAHKALKSIEAVLHKECTVMFFAECAEGLGHSAFASWKGVNRQDLVERLKQGYEPLAHLILSLLTVGESSKIFLVSSLARDEVEAWGFHHLELEEAESCLRSLTVSLPKTSTVLLQPFGAEILVGIE